MYQKILHGEREFLIRVSDQASIPYDPANTDYQRYLEWLAAGNEPEVIEG